jgi:hypothetical protein
MGTRRQFGKQLLSLMTTYSLLECLFLTDAFGKPVQPITNHWAKQLNELCLDLKKTSLSQVQWQAHVEKLLGSIEINDLLKFIDFENLIRNFQYADLGVATKPVVFPTVEGLPANTVFVKKIFGLQKDRSIIPHGHSNMTSSHLVLKGALALRQFEKVEEDEGHLVVKPTVDRIAGVGDASSISDEKNNIHWFIANTQHAFTFDVIMLDLGGKHYDIHNIDIRGGEKIANGLIRAEKMDVEAALKKYGKESHH